MTKDKILGYLFGYKESDTSNEDPQTIKIKFINGQSDKYPTKYKNKKDFWVEQIAEGQVSSIYINPEEIIKLYPVEYAEQKSFGSYDHPYESRKYFFDYDITKEQYMSLQAFNTAVSYFYTKKWETEDILNDALKITIGEFFNNQSTPILDIYKDFLDKMSQCYYAELNQTLNF